MPKNSSLYAEQGPAGLECGWMYLCRRSSGSCLRCKKPSACRKLFMAGVAAMNIYPFRRILSYNSTVYYLTKPNWLDTAIVSLTRCLVWELDDERLHWRAFVGTSSSKLPKDMKGPPPLLPALVGRVFAVESGCVFHIAPQNRSHWDLTQWRLWSWAQWRRLLSFRRMRL